MEDSSMSLPMLVFTEALIPDPGFPAEPDLGPYV